MATLNKLGVFLYQFSNRFCSEIIITIENDADADLNNSIPSSQAFPLSYTSISSKTHCLSLPALPKRSLSCFGTTKKRFTIICGSCAHLFGHVLSDVFNASICILGLPEGRLCRSYLQVEKRDVFLSIDQFPPLDLFKRNSKK